jgi:hypothetical protein
MHARIENDEIVEYPIYDLPSRLGTQLFGDLTQSQNIPYGFVYVQLEDRPLYDFKTQRLEYGKPYQKDGIWYGPWVTIQLTEEEQIAILQSESNLQRNIRNRRLLDCDWTQLADSSVNKVAWAAYRQALRDITNQQGFPFIIEWPTVEQYINT